MAEHFDVFTALLQKLGQTEGRAEGVAVGVEVGSYENPVSFSKLRLERGDQVGVDPHEGCIPYSMNRRFGPRSIAASIASSNSPRNRSSENFSACAFKASGS